MTSKSNITPSITSEQHNSKQTHQSVHQFHLTHTNHQHCVPRINKMTAILVLGGTGTVGSRIVRRLSSLSDDTTTILVASRGATTTTGTTQQHATTNVHHVAFDWHDPSTWPNPFTLSSSPNSANARSIRAIYLIAPPSLDADRVMTDFVDFARERGVRRFILQSASAIEAGGPAMGRVHSYLEELGGRKEVEWGVVRPSWFQGRVFLLFLFFAHFFEVVQTLGGRRMDVTGRTGRRLTGVNRKLCRPAGACQGHQRRQQDLLGHRAGQDPVGVGR